MAALFRRARSTLSYSVAGSIGGGRRVPHAPAPTRYRFAIQGADNKAVHLKGNRSLGGQWTESAWMQSLLTTGADGIKANGGDAQWQALWDVRVSHESLEKHARLQSSKLESIAELLEGKTQPSSRNLFTDVLIAAAAFAVSAILYDRVSQAADLEQLSVDFFNNIATDPQTKETIRMYLVMLAEVIVGSFNPLGNVLGGGLKDQTFSTQVAEESRLAEKILMVILLHPGLTAEALLQGLNAVRKEDPAAMSKVLLFLIESGFVEPMEVKRRIALWPSKATQKDLGSGELATKIKTKLIAKVKAELKAKSEVK